MSILPLLSKVIEKVAYEQLALHMEIVLKQM